MEIAIPVIETQHHGIDLSRRDIFIWVCAIYFLDQLFGVLAETSSASLEKLITDLSAVGIFQYMAWYAIFRLLVLSDTEPRTRWQDVLIAVLLCFLLFLPTARIIWVAAMGAAIYWWIFNAGDPKLRAAAVVLTALSVQAFWGHVLFHLIAFPVLHAETAVVGTLLEATRDGTVWQDNIITGPNGHGIVIYDECSAFHNLSLAMLCWVSVSKLRHQIWRSRDYIVGVAIGTTMILLNVSRLFLMAWNIDLYHYWHEGSGAAIFAVGASLSVLLLSLYGSRSARPLT